MNMVQTPALGYEVILREDTSDRQVWADTFTGRYHLPPGSMPAPATVLDLGANIGLTAAHYKAMWPDAKVVAVEMDADCAELARANAPGCEIRCHAVSGRGGRGYYNPALRAEALTWVRLLDQPLPEGSKIIHSYPLRQTILHSFNAYGKPFELDFLKMDVEGEEWAIFENGEPWAMLVRHLLVELHPVGDMPNDSEYLLSVGKKALFDLGFSVLHHERHPRALWAWR